MTSDLAGNGKRVVFRLPKDRVGAASLMRISPGFFIWSL